MIYILLSIIAYCNLWPIILTTDPENLWAAVSLLGMAAVSRHEFRWYGFLICLIGNIIWIIWGYITVHTSYYVLFGGYLIFNSIGIHDEYATWRKVKEYKFK